MRIGQHVLPNRLFVAPMAGVTDRPFRMLCKKLGAGYAVSEMVTSQPHLYASLKTSRRANHEGETAPIAVQIAGIAPEPMAEAALYNIERGAQIIDINMGCPAKKVCNAYAGSALMQHEELALAIVAAVVDACAPKNVPVTLKMRTGWCQSEKNALAIALGAEARGIAMLTLHGRTREQGYGGQAEHDTVTAVKRAVKVPVVANGDIDSPEKAAAVLAQTGVDALMVGRAAQGRPWIFGDIAHYLEHGRHRAPPATLQVRDWLLEHLDDHYRLYGEFTGTRSARKHIGWALKGLPGGELFRAEMNQLDSSAAQVARLAQWFNELALRHPRFPHKNKTCPWLHDDERSETLDECVRENLEVYFRDLGDQTPHSMHEMVLKLVEKPLLEAVMARCGGNQSRAADWLGINRNTLRRKLSDHQLL